MLEQVPLEVEQSHRQRVETRIELFERNTQLGGAQQQGERVKLDPANLDALLDWAWCLAAQENYDAACRALLQIIEQNKDFRTGEARKLLARLFPLMPQGTPQVAEYRSRLAALLFI